MDNANTQNIIPEVNQPENKDTLKNITKEAFHEGTRSVLKYVFMVGIILVLIVLICFVSSFGAKYLMRNVKEGVRESLPFSDKNDSKKDEQQFNKPEKKNESVIVGKVEWKLTETFQTTDSLKKDTDDEAYCKPSDGTKFVLITYSIRNADRAFVTVLKDRVELYDGGANKYTPLSKVYKCVLDTDDPKDRYVPDILKRDDKKEYKELYEVPKNAKNFRMKVGDLSVINSDYDYISLGF